MRTRAICTIPDCGSKVQGHGFCAKHYWRFRKYGDPNIVKFAPAGQGHVTIYGYRIIAGEREHVTIAKKALGRPIPKGVEIHHVNENKLDNRPSNLVICPDSAYHLLLHRRARAYDACGHADWLKCADCGAYDAPDNLAPRKSPGQRAHAVCIKNYSKFWYLSYQKPRRHEARLRARA